MAPERTRVLCIAEAISLAQLARLNVLARSLDPARYEVHFASASFDPVVFEGSSFMRHAIFTPAPDEVRGRLQRGGRAYGTKVLERYVGEELALFEQVRPHVVVGDLRLSLCVSAPHYGVPYASLVNAYWSRDMERRSFPLPDHPMVRLLGERIAGCLFPIALPWVLAYFAEPVNRLRARHGLAPVGNLVDVLLSGDRVLFPDVPYLTPLRNAPDHHVFLGPVLWSPRLDDTVSLDALPDDGVYVTLGSSGPVCQLPTVVEGLAPLGLPLMVATADRCARELLVGDVYVATYLPGSEAARRARFVVCNGGSSTAYQALAEGRPVIGIASNLDQYLAMSAIEERGAGILLRADTLTADRVEEAARRVLQDPGYMQAAEQAQRELAAVDSAPRFQAILEGLAAR